MKTGVKNEETVSDTEQQEIESLRQKLNEELAKVGSQHVTRPVILSSQPSPRDVTPGQVWDPQLKRFRRI